MIRIGREIHRLPYAGFFFNTLLQISVHCCAPISESVSVHPSFLSYCPRLTICLSVLPALPVVIICESACFHHRVSCPCAKDAKTTAWP